MKKYLQNLDPNKYHYFLAKILDDSGEIIEFKNSPIAVIMPANVIEICNNESSLKYYTSILEELHTKGNWELVHVSYNDPVSFKKVIEDLVRNSKKEYICGIQTQKNS